MSVTSCLNSILVCTCLEDLGWRNFIVFFKTVTWYPVKLPSIYLMAKTQKFFSKSHLIDPSMILIWHLHSEMWNPGYFYFSHLNAPYKKNLPVFNEMGWNFWWLNDETAKTKNCLNSINDKPQWRVLNTPSFLPELAQPVKPSRL